MITKIPQISIIIPSYNRVNLITETLDSVLNQTYQNWECIIVDDGSDDGTQDIIKKYILKDHRFSFIQRFREPKGASVCRNIGIEQSQGDCLIFLDSDDILAVDCLENRIKIVEENHDFDLWVFQTSVFCETVGDTQLFWNQLHKDKNDLYRFIVHDNPWATTASIWKKEIIQKLNGFDEDALCWQDWELHIRALLKELKYYKATEDNFDSYYRINNIKYKTDKQNLVNIDNKILILDKLYSNSLNSKIGLVYKDKYAVIYFRLLILTNKENIKHLKWKIFYSMIKKHLLTLHEAILVLLMILRLANWKNKDLISEQILLKLKKQDKFFNTDNSTYIFTRIKELPNNIKI